MKAILFGLFLATVWMGAAFSAEKPASAAQIRKLVVGHEINIGGAIGHYGADGSYTYNGQFPGTYRISNGSICIQFENGRNRCDKIVIDGGAYTLVNSGGERFGFARN